MTTNGERQKRHKDRMRAAGFRHLEAWVCPELYELLHSEGRPWECYGRTLERPLLGEVAERNVARRERLKFSVTRK